MFAHDLAFAAAKQDSRIQLDISQEKRKSVIPPNRGNLQELFICLPFTNLKNIWSIYSLRCNEGREITAHFYFNCQAVR